MIFDFRPRIQQRNTVNCLYVFSFMPYIICIFRIFTIYSFYPLKSVQFSDLRSRFCCRSHLVSLGKRRFTGLLSNLLLPFGAFIF